MSSNLFHSVVILDAIPDGDLSTARRLREDLRDIAMEFSPTPGIQYYRIESPTDFVAVIRQLTRDVKTRGDYPLLHFEGHGGELGLETANGAGVTWNEIKNELIPLNVAMGLNLMLVLAACHGGTFIRAMNTIERAPVWGVIGPISTVGAADIQSAFGAFYAAMFRGKSTTVAIKALNENGGVKYYRTSAERFFYEVWCRYQKEECSNSKLEKRARSIRKKAKVDRRITKVPSIGNLKRKLKSSESELFEKYRDTYFMFDRYPGNSTRFKVTYSEAMKRCQR
jgi:hypothetical protein